MPVKPFIFKSEDEAVRKLREFSANLKVPQRDFNKSQIIEFSIQSNIFRALPLKKVKPSELYRRWADSNFSSLIKNMSKIERKDSFAEMLFSYAEDLISYWHKNTYTNSEKIGYGPAIKIINLLIKAIQETSYHQKTIWRFQHVPFDYYTLLLLRRIINDISNLQYKITVPASPSMSFIGNKESYLIFMDVIFRLSKKARIHPIVYDYWAWNKTHNSN
jgi:hypothetical protein